MCAVTYQYCTLRNILPDCARNANPLLKKKGIEIGNFRFTNGFLNQGDLNGNHFEIVIRNLKRVRLRPTWINDDASMGTQESFVPCSSNHIEAMIERVKKGGFVNYFGEQRVGTAGKEEHVGVRSIDIGRAMLKEDFPLAIRSLMRGRSKSASGAYVEGEKLRNAREVFFDTDEDPDATLAAIPKGNYMLRERSVLKGLKRYGRDNPLAAIRCVNHSVMMFWINAFQSYIWNRVATLRIQSYGMTVMAGDLYVQGDEEIGRNRTNGVVKVVMEPFEIDISQVVLPLPGYGVEYPKNKIGTWYDDILNEEGIQFSKKSVPEATAKSAYRRLIAYPEKMEWETKESYNGNDQNEHFVNSAVFKFSLGSGSYATMLLREMMVSTLSR